MTPVVGRSLILLGLLLASAATVAAFAAGRTRSQELYAWARRLVYGFAGAMARSCTLASSAP